VHPFSNLFVYTWETQPVQAWPGVKDRTITSCEDSSMESDAVRKSVRQHYGKIASQSGGCGCTPSCCGSAPARDAAEVSKELGYSADDVHAVPDGANLGLGCGNPLAIASLTPGQTVLDLGSGAGFDAFLAARAVGPAGLVIGVDMTAEMLSKARQNAARGGYTNVEFRLGEIESLPVADACVDVIISNCVINLSPDKARVFREAFRVLKSGGRLAISDVVGTAPMPESMRQDLELLAGCVAGTSLIDDVKAMLRSAGFTGIRVEPKPSSRETIAQWFPGRGIEDYVVSATIEAVK
jgi:arsenite methyltransferase